MSDNMFARATARGPLRQVAVGFGMAVAAYALVGLGAGAAAAAPQQPFAADDPIPGLPGGAGGAVNIANSLFGSLSGLINNIVPGAGDLLMPATGALGGGGGLPGGLPGGLGGLPGGLPGQALPGQTPGLGAIPGQTPRTRRLSQVRRRGSAATRSWPARTASRPGPRLIPVVSAGQRTPDAGSVGRPARPGLVGETRAAARWCTFRSSSSWLLPATA